ncbi:Terminal uridylyltransferase 4 [Holothuria leucospilota]|uniref:Terminal uridylyltransferase 4 n=1 Tax=Holothuria leucospilota TaxID=206669 RepID=A0A9Q1C922_HOLLE|nr:Terminal uridylyltransferase 4 [Holothuria leucospilota]
MVNTQFFTFLFVRKMERKETFGDNMTSSTHPGLISDVPDVGLLEINDMKDKSVSQKDEKETKKSSVASKSRRAPGKISRYLENKDNVKRNEPDPTGTSQNPSKKNNNDRLGIPRNSAKNSKPDPIGTPRSRSRKHPDAIRTPQNTVNNNQPDGTPHNDNGAANSNQPDLIGAQGRIANSNQFDPAGTPHNITQNKCFDGIGTASNTSKNVQFDPTGTPTNSASMRNSQPDAIGAPRIAAKFNHPEPIGTPHRTGKKNQPDPIGTPRRKNYNDNKRNRASHEREREKRQSNSENTVGVEEGKVPTIIKQKVTDKTHTNSDPIGIPSNNNQMCDLSQSLLEDQTLQSTFEEGSSLEVSFDQPSLEGEGDGKQTGDGLSKGDSEAHGLLIDNQPVYTPEEEELKAKGIFKLHKKKLKFPRAKYFCRLCNYHMDSVKECQDHVSQTRHNRLMKNKIAAEHFQELPKLSSSHVKALSSTLEEIVKDVGLTDEMMAERQVVADRVNSIIGKVMPDCQVDMYGSSVSGFGFKTSGINLNIKTTGKKTPAELLLEALEIISREKKHFESVEAKFEEKFPVISFIDKARVTTAVNLEPALTLLWLHLIYYCCTGTVTLGSGP